LADMAERKKILYGTSIWQASVALCLAILALTDALSPYTILVSVFLFGIGFAFASPASASVEVEMVPPEHLASANTLGGLQMNIAGIIGPLIGGFLVSLSEPGSAFAGQQCRFPVAAPGHLGLEKAGTRDENCTRGFLCNDRNGDPLRSLHAGHKSDLGPTRPFLVLHLHHSSPYAGGRFEGIALGSIEIGIPVHCDGDRLGDRSGLHHAAGASAPVAK
jgi:hypothetical protein